MSYWITCTLESEKTCDFSLLDPSKNFGEFPQSVISGTNEA